MAPDVNQGISMVMDFDSQMPPMSNSSDDFESSYSEVEVSILSDRAMTDDSDDGGNDDDATSSSEEEEVEEEEGISKFQFFQGQYEELVETEDLKGLSDGFSEEEPPEDLFAEANLQQREQHQGWATTTTTTTTAPTSSTSLPSKPVAVAVGVDAIDTREKAPSSERRKNNYDDTTGSRNRAAPPSRDGQISARSTRERVDSIHTDSTPTTESDDLKSSTRTKSNSNSPKKQKKKLPSASNTTNNNNDDSTKRGGLDHKSIKIPAIHNNKQEGDDDYIRRKIQQENIRRSRSLSRSDKSRSTGNGPHRPRKSRSRSHSHNYHEKPTSEKSLKGSHRQNFQPLDNSLHGSSSSGSGGRHHRKQQERSRSNPRSTSGPRRLASIHTSTPSNQLTGSTHKSGSSKHSNFDGSKRVSWKSDPKASFSDWTLHILYRDSNRKRRIDVYHVHRNIVGFGHRKSRYLLRDIMEVELQELIDSSNKSEVELQEIINSNKRHNNGYTTNNNNGKTKDTIITRLKLPTESQARSVPMVLDFMYYTNETKQRMSADRSCNVFKVAEGLEVQALQKAIGEFYMKNLSLKNLGEFLTAATKVKADKLLFICKAKIGQMITVKPELSAMVPPKFMAEILSISSRQLTHARAKEPKKYTVELIVSQSKYWSKAACICASKNASTMTKRIFQKLTAEESLPYIDVSATPKLLKMESKFLERERKNASGGSGRKSNQLTSLQRRCVESIANDFDAFQRCFDSHQQIAENLKHLPSNILSEILMKLLTRP